MLNITSKVAGIIPQMIKAASELFFQEAPMAWVHEKIHLKFFVHCPWVLLAIPSVAFDLIDASITLTVMLIGYGVSMLEKVPEIPKPLKLAVTVPPKFFLVLIEIVKDVFLGYISVAFWGKEMSKYQQRETVWGAFVPGKWGDLVSLMPSLMIAAYQARRHSQEAAVAAFAEAKITWRLRFKNVFDTVLAIALAPCLLGFNTLPIVGKIFKGMFNFVFGVVLTVLLFSFVSCGGEEPKEESVADQIKNSAVVQTAKEAGGDALTATRDALDKTNTGIRPVDTTAEVMADILTKSELSDSRSETPAASSNDLLPVHPFDAQAATLDRTKKVSPEVKRTLLTMQTTPQTLLHQDEKPETGSLLGWWNGWWTLGVIVLVTGVLVKVFVKRKPDTEHKTKTKFTPAPSSPTRSSRSRLRTFYALRRRALKYRRPPRLRSRDLRRVTVPVRSSLTTDQNQQQTTKNGRFLGLITKVYASVKKWAAAKYQDWEDRSMEECESDSELLYLPNFNDAEK